MPWELWEAVWWGGNTTQVQLWLGHAYDIIEQVGGLRGLGPHRCGYACGSPGSWRWDSFCGTGGRDRCARWGTAPWASHRWRRWWGSWHSGGWRSSTGGGLADSARCGTKFHSPYRGKHLLWGERWVKPEGTSWQQRGSACNPGQGSGLCKVGALPWLSPASSRSEQ